MKKLRVTVEGKVYEVLVEILDEGTPAALPATAPVALSSAASTSSPPPAVAPSVIVPRPTAAVAGAGDIVSPLAGKVVSIDVKPGQAVNEGAQVATVEAMKMNTYIYAPKGGTIGAVLVTAGDAVEEGMALLRLA